MAEAEYVTLVSNDGYSFIIQRSAAGISPILNKMLDPAHGFAESKTNTCHLELNALTVEKVCEYLYYNEKYRDTKEVPEMDIPAELSLELLLAADFLGL